MRIRIVTFRERIKVADYIAVDNTLRRSFISCWQIGNLMYFKASEFDVFTVDVDDIIDIEEQNYD